MNAVPLPTTLSAICSHQLKQNLTHLAPGVGGAVLFSILSVAQRAVGPAHQTNSTRLGVKNVTNSPFTPIFSKSFTRVRYNCLRENPMENSASKSDGEKITETGGSDPTFLALRRPKSFLESLPPVFSQHETLKDNPQPPRTGASCAGIECVGHPHGDSYDFRIRACMAGPHEGEKQKCQS
jgi:hypothetical protein